MTLPVATYRVRSMSGDYLGQVKDLAANIDRGDVLELPSGRDAIVIGRVETGEESVAAMLEVMVAPNSFGGAHPWSRRPAESRG
jgi:hypothetical protein